jgi:Glycosyl transferase family 2
MLTSIAPSSLNSRFTERLFKPRLQQSCPLVSIIINNYNYAQFLREAIESALNQTYPALEVIVVDDGSTDQSQEIITSYQSHIIPIFKQNGGQASAINTGFSASSGEIIIFLDADDYLLPHTVTQVVSTWQPGTAKVHYRLQTMDALGQQLGTHPARAMDSGNVWPVLLKKGRYSTPVTSGNAFDRTVLQQILPMPEPEFRIAADGYLLSLVPFYGQVVSIEQPLGVYRIHGQNLWATSRENPTKRFHQFVQHDLQRYLLLKQQAIALGLQVPDLEAQDYLHLKHRLLSLRSTPELHPCSEDSVLTLMCKGLWATWRYSELKGWSQVQMSFWFLWVGVTPQAAAEWVMDGSLRSKIGLRAAKRLFSHVRNVFRLPLDR